jgi:hypothetical protein
VITLLADVNIEGHITRLIRLMQTEDWRDFWDYLELRFLRFRDIGLSPTEPDAQVWQVCQQQQLYLLTNNRNDDGPDSLEATIRTRNTPASLPVFTLSDADRLLQSKDYATQVVESLYDQLLRIETLRGTGRLYLP